MITTLDNTKEGSTYTIQTKFKDEENTLISPNELTYTVSDTEGNIINKLEDVIITPSSIINITLFGDSLTPGWKIVTLKGIYNSTYGTDLPLRDSCRFFVDDLLKEG